MVSEGAGFASKFPALLGLSLALASWGTGSVRAEQVIVIDIPGVGTDGKGRAEQWGPVFTGGSDFAQHRVVHKGAFGKTKQGAEPGSTATLEHRWNASKDTARLQSVLSDVGAGRNVVVKLDKNMSILSHLFGKPGEAAWVKSTGDFLAAEIKRINPNTKVILNTHSSGTLDAARLNLSLFSEVYLSSNRGSAKSLNSLVARYPGTSFTVIAGDRDFAHDLGKGYFSVTASNLKILNIKNGGLMPWTVHGAVTNPSARVIADLKTVNGIQRVQGPLGQIITAKNPTGFIVPMAISPIGTTVMPQTRLGIFPGGYTKPGDGPFRLPGGWNRPGGPFGGLDGLGGIGRGGFGGIGGGIGGLGGGTRNSGGGFGPSRR